MFSVLPTCYLNEVDKATNVVLQKMKTVLNTHYNTVFSLEYLEGEQIDFFGPKQPKEPIVISTTVFMMKMISNLKTRGYFES